MPDDSNDADWRDRSETIQRDPARVRPIAEEVLDEIRKQDCGESAAAVQVPSLEGSLFFYVGDHEVSRPDLIRAAAFLIETIALHDLHQEGML